MALPYFFACCLRVLINAHFKRFSPNKELKNCFILIQHIVFTTNPLNAFHILPRTTFLFMTSLFFFICQSSTLIRNQAKCACFKKIKFEIMAVPSWHGLLSAFYPNENITKFAKNSKFYIFMFLSEKIQFYIAYLSRLKWAAHPFILNKCRSKNHGQI